MKWMYLVATHKAEPPRCTATLSPLPTLHAWLHAALSLTNQDLWKYSLPAPLSVVRRAHGYKCAPCWSICRYTACKTKPPLLFPPPPSHHHPPVPKGSSTQINWKKEECNVVLPLHLSERGVRRGRTHRQYGGTISLHLSQTVSSLMGWNMAHMYIYLYFICVYWLTGAQASSNSQKNMQWLFVSYYVPPTSQFSLTTLKIRRLSQTAC